MWGPNFVIYFDAATGIYFSDVLIFEMVLEVLEMMPSTLNHSC